MTAKAFNSVVELSDKIDKFFIQCDEKEEPYTVLGMCLYLDITRETLSEYFHKEAYSDTIKKAKAKIENYAEKRLFEGKNPAGIIFNLKNNFNWSDKQEITNTNVNIDAATLSPEDRAARLAELKAKLMEE